MRCSVIWNAGLQVAIAFTCFFEVTSLEDDRWGPPCLASHLLEELHAFRVALVIDVGLPDVTLLEGLPRQRLKNVRHWLIIHRRGGYLLVANDASHVPFVAVSER